MALCQRHSIATTCTTNDSATYVGAADDVTAFAGAADGSSAYNAPPTPPPWSVHLPSYPLRVICRFCFNPVTHGPRADLPYKNRADLPEGRELRANVIAALSLRVS
jgi:hypothetical protein